MTYSEQLRFISRVRLPLIIAVVFIHVQTPSIPHSADWWFIKILGEEIGRIGVPLFFAISGLLFFNSFQKSDYVKDMIKIGGGETKEENKVFDCSIPYLESDPVFLLSCNRQCKYC